MIVVVVVVVVMIVVVVVVVVVFIRAINRDTGTNQGSWTWSLHERLQHQQRPKVDVDELVWSGECSDQAPHPAGETGTKMQTAIK